MNFPKLKECYRYEQIGDEGIVLISEDNYSFLTGKPYLVVCPHLNGENTVDQIIDKVEDLISMPEIYFVLESLKEQGHIVESTNHLSKSIESFWDILEVDASQVVDHLAEKKVGVKILGDIGDVSQLNQILKSSDINIAKESETVDFYLVVTDDYDRQDLVNFNKQMIKSKTPWLLIKPVGIQPWIGPLFNTNDESVCWECMMQRIRANRQMETYIQNIKEDKSPIVTAKSAYPASVNIALNLATLEIAKHLADPSTDSLHNQLLTVHSKTLEVTKHDIVKRPQCKVCGEPELSNRNRPMPIVELGASPKLFRNDGGHRTSLPEVTFEKYKHHVSPYTGVVSSLSRLDKFGESSLIYTYGAGHNFAMMNHRGMFFMLKNLRGRSGGKGMTDVQAKLSGMCEAIERYSGVFRGDEPVIKAKYEDIADKALHPYEYLHFSDWQYDNRDWWNSTHKSDYHMVPFRFQEEREIEWTAFTDLATSKQVYVPTGYSYFGHPDIVDYFDTACDANGNAAGNTLEEAIVQGFLELVERDSVGIWWYNMLQRQEVDIDSFEIGYLTELQNYYKSIDRDLTVIDITSDLGVHTFAAVSKKVNREVQDIVLGFGSHLDPKIALLRAITEVNQFMPCVSNSNEEGETDYWYDDPQAIHWWMTATIENQPYLKPDPNLPKLKYSDYKDLSADDLKDDVTTLMEIVAAKGMKTYVLDQTRPDIGLSVVKVMVPGMRHFWKRFAPGRLYDVPVEMGWRKEKIHEKDLNPIGIFF